MSDLYPTNCCGIRELVGVHYIASPHAALQDTARQWFDANMKAAFVFFSATSDSTKGTQLAAYIKKHKLGKITKTRSKLNPNSSNILTMWMWEVNATNFARFYKNQK